MNEVHQAAQPSPSLARFSAMDKVVVAGYLFSIDDDNYSSWLVSHRHCPYLIDFVDTSSASLMSHPYRGYLINSVNIVDVDGGVSSSDQGAGLTAHDVCAV